MHRRPARYLRHDLNPVATTAAVTPDADLIGRALETLMGAVGCPGCGRLGLHFDAPGASGGGFRSAGRQGFAAQAIDFVDDEAVAS